MTNLANGLVRNGVSQDLDGIYIYIHTLYIYIIIIIYIYIDISDFILNFTVEIAMVGHRALILDTVCGESHSCGYY